MKNTFKALIAEFHEEQLPNVTHRDIDIPKLPEHVHKGIVFIGMRRAGKTYAMYQHMHSLINQGHSKKQLIYINFEDERLSDTTVQQLQHILDAYYELYPSQHELFLFLDEIHTVPGWENFVRRMIERSSIRVFVSGSSAKMLSKEIATSLRGRVFTREIFPFSFQEYLHHKKQTKQHPTTAKQRANLNHHLQYYLTWGGFPESIGMSESLHRELLQGYVEIVLYRDIIERHEVKNVAALKKALFLSLKRPATLNSINKLYGQLKSMGISVSRGSLYDYFDYFNDAYCILSVPAFDFSESKANLKPNKIYPIDTGLIHAYSIKSEFDKAAQLETLVFLSLRRQYERIYYYHTPNGKEVDFLSIDNKEQIQLYQVSLNMQSSSTLQREHSALLEAMQNFKLDQGIIVTLDETAEHVYPEGVVKTVALLDFILKN